MRITTWWSNLLQPDNHLDTAKSAFSLLNRVLKHNLIWIPTPMMRWQYEVTVQMQLQETSSALWPLEVKMG